MPRRWQTLFCALPLLWSASLFASGPDTDKDGVANNRDRCPQTPLNKPVNLSGCPFPYEGALFTVQFKPRSAWIDGDQTLALRQVAKQLLEVMDEFPGAEVAVRGFHGGKSDQSKAENLSAMRAKAVMRQLKLSRVPKQAMQVEGLGRAAVAGKEADARRVDVLLLEWRPKAP